ncbi:hypothetical protein SDRG_13046 [Saprolegnia diclina VS20]|uniref:Amino acid permease/ SLC12A domain-containing protein n=1 Tax=Saprolegnia diclina (strain VS20) TaxID=1156394 RepID=T0RAG8_SAPDV|nr:hypothetical protein SDRG_13046 [Saprolegnia diclina VS20]EQC29173.1 hypothetical protein SDRG_13046 [Saprolegnia diclina VS20]|eukprot:XP_008617351.1 hypothetical protein SDRG_13046 [Saprolegnia diclina VS20]
MQPTTIDLYALGITIVVGGQYFSWNAGLVAGFYSYLGATLLMGVAYCCMALCLAEISSALPFAGGAYGIARCSLGFYLGFMIGCCETLEYIAYVASSVLTLGDMLTMLLPALGPARPALWLLIYALALSLHLAGGAVFWRANRVLAFLALLIIVAYILGSLAVTSPTANASSDALYRFEFRQVLKQMPESAWFFVGIESLNMASDDVANPRQQIPRAQLLCVLTLTILGISVLSTSSFVAPGVTALATAAVPFNNGSILHLLST